MLLGKPSDANASRGSTASRLGGAAEAVYYVFAACFGGDSYEYSSAPLKILQIALLIFIFVTGATYTANLAQIMIVSQHNPRVSSLDEMNRRGLKACVKRGAAYAAHMPELFPEIDLVEIDPRFPKEAVDKMEDGDCDAYVDSSATLELLAGLRDNCDANLVTFSVLRLFREPLTGKPMKTRHRRTW